jgi:hypothetical protein
MRTYTHTSTHTYARTLKQNRVDDCCDCDAGVNACDSTKPDEKDGDEWTTKALIIAGGALTCIGIIVYM